MNYVREIQRERTGKAGRPASQLFETHPGNLTFNTFNPLQEADSDNSDNKMYLMYENRDMESEIEPMADTVETPPAETYGGVI